MKKKNECGLGINKFHSIFSCLVANDDDEIEQLLQILRINSINLWSGFGVVACDESIYKYQPSSKIKHEFEANFDPIPVVYIPRKPNPNGLLSYSLVCKSTTTKKPFTIDLIPFYKLPKLSPRECCMKMIERWPYQVKPHVVVMDSAFSSVNFMTHLLSKGVVSTGSIRTSELPGVWKLLERDLQQKQKQWCAVANDDKILLSTLQNKNRDQNVYHHLITTAFNFKTIQINQSRKKQQQSKSEQLKLVQNRNHLQLKQFADENNIKSGGSKKELLERIERVYFPDDNSVSNEEYIYYLIFQKENLKEILFIITFTETILMLLI